jgi:putative tricarboxylic transport membrane protein
VRRVHLTTAIAFVALAAVVMFDTRAGALIDRTGRSPGGIGAGFYPFWAAAFLGVGALVLVYQSVRALRTADGPFAERQGLLAVVKLVIPVVVATAGLVWLGLYLITGLYMGFFARFIGRYGWHWVALIALAVPTLIYLIFELGFRVRLPKSVFYVQGFPI